MGLHQDTDMIEMVAALEAEAICAHNISVCTAIQTLKCCNLLLIAEAFEVTRPLPRLLCAYCGTKASNGLAVCRSG